MQLAWRHAEMHVISLRYHMEVYKSISPFLAANIHQIKWSHADLRQSKGGKDTVKSTFTSFQPIETLRRLNKLYICEQGEYHPLPYHRYFLTNQLMFWFDFVKMSTIIFHQIYCINCEWWKGPIFTSTRSLPLNTARKDRQNSRLS